MPTGWRPDDVKLKHPIKTIEDPSEQVKYKTENSISLIYWSYIQMFIGVALMFHLFVLSSSVSTPSTLLYALFLVVHVFAYTSLLDNKKYAIYIECTKVTVGIICLLYTSPSPRDGLLSRMPSSA